MTIRIARFARWTVLFAWISMMDDGCKEQVATVVSGIAPQVVNGR